MVSDAIQIYAQILEQCIPFAIVFGIGNIIVSTFLRVAFGGKLWFGK